MKRRLFAALALAGSLSLAGCGGGGGDEVPTVSLLAAYSSIDKGMTYKQVRDIVGVDSNAGIEDYGPEITYSWQVGKGTNTPELLIVQFRNDAAYGKIYEARGREESQYW